MPDVTIDGIRYVPIVDEAGDMPTGRVGIAVTTYGRDAILQDTLERLTPLLPPGAVAVVVDDGSDTSVAPEAPWELIKLEQNLGAPSAKNRCLEALYEAGVEHFFLFDDDTYPTEGGWWIPYAASPEPHLQYQFPSAPDHWPIRELRRDGQHRAFERSRGPMLYVHRSAVDEVGGFHCAFGKRGGWHEDFSLRVNEAGLTKYPFQDVIAPALYCRDQDEKGISSRSHKAHSLWQYVDRASLPRYAEFRTTPVPVLVPRRPDGGHRDELWKFLQEAVWADRSDYQLIEGLHPWGPFNRAAALNTAARIAGNWDVAVISDGDAWVPDAQLDAAVEAARETGKLVSALTEVKMLSEASTQTILETGDRSKGRASSVKKKDGETRSICLAVPRAVFEAVGGFDEGYRHWGAEDEAFWHACKVAAGAPERVSGPAFHLYHPPASTREERSTDPAYQRNWDRWLRFSQLTTLEGIRSFT
ncbi:hypothetical protein Q7C18_02830 [Nesterenkonia sp. CL21]|uniref:glycosyltransferase family 2 protein n=1 Tax=Nesterenkonia sp. CL21 TaxID=3064894 RepID=UPI00287AD382|nr:galactosyltransferase-related protein [Nesterenkonia sp. CL21]MDS2171624.1 hypothetical protein [Nesterenkonia sp. CL21]